MIVIATKNMNIESVIPKIEFSIICGSNKNNVVHNTEIFFLKNVRHKK